MRASTPARAEGAAQVLVAVTLAALAALVAPRLFVLFDEAYNLNASLTLAQHGLYATQAGGRFTLFDAQVSTGPALLAPLAVALRLGGPTLATARAAMLVIFLLCLALAWWGAHELLHSRRAALLFVAVFALTPLALEFGLCVMGDVPALALAVGGFGLVQRAGRASSPSPALLAAGCLFGLSVLAKDIMLLLAPALALAWVAQAVAARRQGQSVSWRWLWPALALALCAIAWRAVQQLAVHWLLPAHELALWQIASSSTLRRLWDTVSWAPLSHSAAAWQISVEYFRPLLLGLAVAALGLLLLRRSAAERGARGAPFAWIALSLSCALWLGWFYLLSGPAATHRHLLPGLVLAELVIVRTALDLTAAGRRQPAARLASAALALCLAWSILHGAGYLRLYLASSEPRLAMQQSAAAWLRDNTPPHTLLYGWGWYAPWHVAFLAQRGAARIAPDDAQAGAPGGFFVLSPEIDWGGSTDDRLRAYLATLGPPVVEQRLYPVYRME